MFLFFAAWKLQQMRMRNDDAPPVTKRSHGLAGEVHYAACLPLPSLSPSCLPATRWPLKRPSRTLKKSKCIYTRRRKTKSDKAPQPSAEQNCVFGARRNCHNEGHVFRRLLKNVTVNVILAHCREHIREFSHGALYSGVNPAADRGDT